MEIKLPGFDDWIIDMAYEKKRWADVYRKVNGEWEHFCNFQGLDAFYDALECLIEEGLGLTEDAVCECQEDMPEPEEHDGHYISIPREAETYQH